MRRLLVTLLIAGATVLVGHSPAQAKGCVHNTLQQQAHSADAVFTAKVTGVERTGDVASYAVEVETVYKGAVHAQMTVRSQADGLGALQNIVAGRRYTFFGSLDGTVVQANGCGPTRGVSAAFTAQVVQILGEGKAPMGGTPATPATPIFVRTDSTEPASFSRLAAPGGALVIVGLLGLLLLRRKSA